MYNENTLNQDNTQARYESSAVRPAFSTKLMVKTLAAQKPKQPPQVKLARPQLVAVTKSEPQLVSDYVDSVPKHWRAPHLTLVSNANIKDANAGQVKNPSTSDVTALLRNPWFMPTVKEVGLAGMFKLFGNRPVKRHEEEQAQTKGFRVR